MVKSDKDNIIAGDGVAGDDKYNIMVVDGETGDDKFLGCV